MKSQILKILKDGRWHGCSDFLHLGLSYRNRIGELREEGWNILSVKEEGTVTYKYRLVLDTPPPLTKPASPLVFKPSPPIAPLDTSGGSFKQPKLF